MPRNRRDNRLTSRKRRRLVTQVKAEGGDCWRCGEPIDLALKWPHTRSFSLDEVVERALGGNPESRADVAPAHLGCNSRAGARFGNALRAGRTPARHRGSAAGGAYTSRSWG